jgi:hypothetical protein
MQEEDAEADLQQVENVLASVITDPKHLATVAAKFRYMHPELSIINYRIIARMCRYHWILRI